MFKILHHLYQMIHEPPTHIPLQSCQKVLQVWLEKAYILKCSEFGGFIAACAIPTTIYQHYNNHQKYPYIYRQYVSTFDLAIHKQYTAIPGDTVPYIHAHTFTKIPVLTKRRLQTFLHRRKTPSQALDWWQMLLLWHEPLLL